MPRRRGACHMRDRTCVRSGRWKAGRESPSGENNPSGKGGIVLTQGFSEWYYSRDKRSLKRYRDIGKM